MNAPEGPRRLDPGRAVEEAREDRGLPEEPAPRLPQQPISTRRYQWMIGGFGLLLVIVFSIYLNTGHRSGGVGVPAGRPILRFVAPLAVDNLNVPANGHPQCNPARPARRGLNVCGRGALVLTFFVTGATTCVNQVDTLQRLAGRFPSVRFAAVAVNANRATTDRLVRRHGWTIRVAYDLTGAIGQLYGVVGCPITELVRPGGIVLQRVIGARSASALAPEVARLAHLARASAGA